VDFVHIHCETEYCQMTVFRVLRKPGNVMKTKYRQTATFMAYS